MSASTARYWAEQREELYQKIAELEDGMTKARAMNRALDNEVRGLKEHIATLEIERDHALELLDKAMRRIEVLEGS